MTLTVHSHNHRSISHSDYHQLLALRYKVFSQRLNWELNVSDNSESDQYDVERADYLYIKNAQQNIVGCWRILPTTESYMLKDTFEVLLGCEDAPQNSAIYELSRFAVDKDHSQQSGGISNVTLTMFQALYHYAQTHSIDSYVTVTSLAIEKLISRMGIPNQRIGDKQVHMLGDTKSVVLSIPMNEQYQLAVGLGQKAS